MKSKINRENIKGFFQGWGRFLGKRSSVLFREFNLLKNLLEPEDHVSEQAEYRLKVVATKSPECLGKKGCVHCGCTFPEKAFEDRGCSNTENPCYTNMLNKEDWDKFKNGISKI